MTNESALEITPEKPTQVRWNLTVSQEMNQFVEDFWHEEKLASKSESIRELIALGLAAQKQRRNEAA